MSSIKMTRHKAYLDYLPRESIDRRLSDRIAHEVVKSQEKMILAATLGMTAKERNAYLFGKFTTGEPSNAWAGASAAEIEKQIDDILYNFSRKPPPLKDLNWDVNPFQQCERRIWHELPISALDIDTSEPESEYPDGHEDPMSAIRDMCR